MKPKNIPQAKQLIERYRTITLEEIEKKWYINGDITAYRLTGFGNKYTCTLCLEVNYKCASCVHSFMLEAYGCIRHKTFDNIEIAQTPKQLLKAFRNRANYIENLLKQYE